jgi:hypothetical protein
VGVPQARRSIGAEEGEGVTSELLPQPGGFEGFARQRPFMPTGRRPGHAGRGARTYAQTLTAVTPTRVG